MLQLFPVGRSPTVGIIAHVESHDSYTILQRHPASTPHRSPATLAPLHMVTITEWPEEGCSPPT